MIICNEFKEIQEKKKNISHMTTERNGSGRRGNRGARTEAEAEVEATEAETRKNWLQGVQLTF
jgi:hypothetical protein